MTGAFGNGRQGRHPVVIDVAAQPSAKLLQYVKICSLYGAGFYYIPGTDTCLKVGGFVRAEMNFNAHGSFIPASGNHDARSYDFENTRVRGAISVDARSQTEYGTLRSYANIVTEFNNGAGGGSGTKIWSNRAFIQWAGFTFGQADSFFDFFSFTPYSNQGNWLVSDLGGGGTQVFAYTAQFGNGLSATLSAEDTSARRHDIWGDTYAGRQWPDIVGNLRMDQAWGSAQIMGAIHQVRTVTGDFNKVGWAAGAGVKVNLPWGQGDNIAAQVDYTKGASSYAFEMTGGPVGSWNVSENGTDFAYANGQDAVNIGTSLELATAWSVGAGLVHHWNPQWRTSIYGGYGEYSFPSAVKDLLVGSPDWSFSQIGTMTAWTPVRNLTFSVDLMYNHVGTASNSGGVYEAAASDVGWFQGMFRVQRNFWP